MREDHKDPKGFNSSYNISLVVGPSSSICTAVGGGSALSSIPPDFIAHPYKPDRRKAKSSPKQILEIYLETHQFSCPRKKTSGERTCCLSCRSVVSYLRASAIHVPLIGTTILPLYGLYPVSFKQSSTSLAVWSKPFKV